MSQFGWDNKKGKERGGAVHPGGEGLPTGCVRAPGA